MLKYQMRETEIRKTFIYINRPSIERHVFTLTDGRNRNSKDGEVSNGRNRKTVKFQMGEIENQNKNESSKSEIEPQNRNRCYRVSIAASIGFGT